MAMMVLGDVGLGVSVHSVSITVVGSNVGRVIMSDNLAYAVV